MTAMTHINEQGEKVKLLEQIETNKYDTRFFWVETEFGYVTSIMEKHFVRDFKKL